MARVRSPKTTLLTGLIIGVVAFAVYLPAFKIGFLDGWWYLEWAARLSFDRYLIQFFDPAYITQGYRPVQGLYMYLLYQIFGFNADGYHLAHNLLHAANSILLFIIVGRLGKNQRLAFVAAIIYGVLPSYSLAVFWHAVVDPLSGFFCLLTILLWILFLDTPRRLNYWMAFGAYILALLSKEIAVFLPLWLFLLEWWFHGGKPSLRLDVLRYAPFLVAWIPYLYQVIQVQSHGEFAGQFGFRIGPHMLGNLIPYLAILAFPWTNEMPVAGIYYVWLAVALLGYIGVMVWKRSRVLLFLALFAVLNISPLLGFPLDYFNARYLYLSTTVSAVLLAALFEFVWQRLGSRRLTAVVLAAILGIVVVASGSSIAGAAAGLAEYTRQTRVPFRDISRQHPTFPPDSYVYIVHSPLTTVWDFEGMFFSRYGDNVTVNATDAGRPANLRNYANAYVYYFDPTGKPVELRVDKDVVLQAAPSLPGRFEIPVALEQFEIPSVRLERGKALVVILNWRADAKLAKNYMVFAYLVDHGGKHIAEYEAEPANGKLPTSQWDPHRTIIDAAILPIPRDATVGEDYVLELGLYDPENGRRLAVSDANGLTIGDRIVVSSFSVLP